MSSAFEEKHSILYVDKILTHIIKIQALGKFDKTVLQDTKIKNWSDI